MGEVGGVVSFHWKEMGETCDLQFAGLESVARLCAQVVVAKPLEPTWRGRRSRFLGQQLGFMGLSGLWAMIFAKPLHGCADVRVGVLPAEMRG